MSTDGRCAESNLEHKDGMARLTFLLYTVSTEIKKETKYEMTGDDVNSVQMHDIKLI